MRALVRAAKLVFCFFPAFAFNSRHSAAQCRWSGMYFDAPVTDFDSEEDTERSLADYDHPSRDSDISNNSNSDIPVLRSQSCSVHEFGEFEDNYGWIQCRSKSFPSRVYYHNTRSGCNTWYRPISRYINIPVVSVGRVSRLEPEERENCISHNFRIFRDYKMEDFY